MTQYENDMRAAHETCTWTIVRPGRKKRLRTTVLESGGRVEKLIAQVA